MSDIAVDVRDLSKSFDIWGGKNLTLKSLAINLIKRQPVDRQQFWGLKNVSFTVKKGDTLGIIGSNGSGKTSLLRILAGIVYPTTGSVVVNGKITTLFELGTGFHPDLTGKENIYLNGSILGLKRGEIEKKFDKIVAFSELEKFIDTPIKHYSSGMQVRLAFSVAINLNPEVLLVDEVLAVGDAEFQSKSFSVFQDYRRSGATTVIVTHDLDVVKTVCTKAMLLKKGEVVKIGKPNDVVATYQREILKDQETNFSVEEKKRFGDGLAKVEEVWVEDYSSRKTRSVEGPELIIKMKCKFFANCVKPIFGVIIKDKNDRQILVTNTLRKNVKVGNYKRGDQIIVVYRIPNVFEAGYYNLSPAIAHADERKFYDWRTDCLEFYIKQLFPSGGIINPPHTITLD